MAEAPAFADLLLQGPGASARVSRMARPSWSAAASIPKF